ncbi:MAG TPA: mercuric reductase [Longimicrobium sp.]|nr:mercuric reductase [Longimicrobium sp.]
MERFDLAVIGGGTAGLVSSAVSAGIGAKTALIERHRLGGECLWTGCVPSKAILRSAAVLATLRRAREYGIDAGGDARADFARVMERVREVIARIEPHDSPERFRGMGVDVIEGTARFVSPEEVEVDGRRVRAKRWIVATGSRTAVPDVPGLAEAGYQTHETVWAMRRLPESLLVLGAGPVGAELAQAFARLGSRVTLAGKGGQVLEREDPEIAAVLHRALEREGIAVRLGAAATRVRAEGGLKVVTLRTSTGETEVRAEEILVATGRRPNVEGLGLERIGVEVGEDGITVDATLRTSAANVFAAGDVVGPYRFTHVADYQARLAAPNALFPVRRKVDYRVVPWCTFTEPEVARVGMTEAEARERLGAGVSVFRYAHDSLDRAVCDGEPEGLTRVVVDAKGRIVGAHIAGPRAGESIHEAVLAVRHRLKLSDLSGMIHVYPTYPESLKRSADAFLRAKYSGGVARKVADLAVRWFV